MGDVLTLKEQVEWWQEEAAGYQRALVKAEAEVGQLRGERDAARQWFEDNFAGEDDEPDELTLVDMFVAVFQWGDGAWGHAGRELERADIANDRFVKAHERAEAAVRAGGNAADLREALERIDRVGHRIKDWSQGGDGVAHSDNCSGCVAREALAVLEPGEEKT